MTKEEVKRVCKELGLRDWTRLKPPVTKAEAAKILKHISHEGMKIELEQFRAGLEVELEHGTMFPAYNATNNHPILTGKIVFAHFMETLDYYRRLEVMELQGDLFKSVANGAPEKAKKYAKRLAKAKAELAEAENKQIK